MGKVADVYLSQHEGQFMVTRLEEERDEKTGAALGANHVHGVYATLSEAVEVGEALAAEHGIAFDATVR
jgi:hypothetical protein